MADRTIKIQLQADVEGLVSGLRTAKGAIRSYSNDLASTARKNSQAWDTAGSTLTRFGAVATAGVGLAVKAAMDWESAWTGVTKTVEGTPAQLNKVEEGLRGLSKTLPASHEEIAGVAEAAGQLGISTSNVVEFTETMINLGETTNMSAEQAATSLARFGNIMGTSESNIDNVASSIVGLGNNFATTESEITDMALRLAGAGQQAGLSEGDVLGLSTALSSVGVEAEAGGTAMSTTMTQIGSAVDTQSDKLDQFAAVAGMSADEFATAWQDDAGGALTAFITGLGDTDRLGQSTNQTLQDLGITALRQSDSLRRLSSAQGLVTDAMKTGNEEYEANDALQKEAEKRYETSASKIRIASNSIKDSAIDFGAAFLPVLATAADGVVKLTDVISAVPDPIKKVSGIVAGLGGVALLGAGGFMKLVPAVADTVDAFNKLAPAGSKARTAMTKLGKLGLRAGAVGAVAAAVGLVVDQLSRAGVAAPEVDKITTSLERLGNTGKQADFDKFNNMFGGKDSGWNWAIEADQQANAVNTLSDAFKRLNKSRSEGFFGDSSGRSGKGDYLFWDSAAFNQAEADVEAFDAALSDAVNSGNYEAIAGGQAAVANAAADAGLSIAEVKAELPGYTDALAGSAVAAEQSANTGLDSAQSALQKTMSDTTATADDQTAALYNLQAAQLAANQAALAADNSQIALEAAYDAATAAAKENGQTLDINTEKGRANKTSLLNIAGAALQASEDMRKLGASDKEIAGTMGRSREQFIRAAQQMGATKQQAKALADQYGLIPEKVNTEVDANIVPAKKKTESFKEYANRLKGAIVKIDANAVPARKKGENIRDYIKRLKGALIKVDADTSEAKKKGDAAKKDIKGKKAEVKVGADTKDAKKKTGDVKRDLKGIKGKKVKVGVDSRGAVTGLGDVKGKLKGLPKKTVIDLGIEKGSLNKGVSTAKSQLKGIPDKTVKVKADTGSSKKDVEGVDGAVKGLKGKTVDAKVDTSGQASKVSTLQANINSLSGKTVNVSVNTTRTNTTINRTRNEKAGGGAIYGGRPNKDSVPALLMPGEHVLTKRDVAALGGQEGVYAFRASLHAQAAARYKVGGAVKSAAESVRDAEKRRNAALKALRKARKAKVTGKGDAREKNQAKKDKRVAAAQKTYDKRTNTLGKERDRLAMLRDQQREQKIGLRRGDQRRSATSDLSGAYSLVDEMLSISRSGSMPGRYGRRLGKNAYNAEKSMRKLYKNAAGVEKSLEKATKRVENLKQISEQAASTIKDGFNLSEVQSPWTGKAATTGKEYLTGATSYASKAKRFAAKLKKLQQAGYSGVVLQEVAAMGVDEGTVAADALLQLKPKEVKSLNQAYKDTAKYANQAGQYVSAGFYKGGLSAAEGVIAGLKKKQKKIDKQIGNMATSMIKALKKALGIRSPSKEFEKLGLSSGDGMVVGLHKSIPAVDKAAGELAAVPGQVAPSVYAGAPVPGAGTTSVVVDRGAMAEAMNGVRMTLLVDGKPIEAVAQTVVDSNLTAYATSVRGGRR